jgi:DME family drug/metabolite transporter
LAATPSADLAVMLLAGTLNAFSFIFMTKALQLTNVAYAYALNATQATMGALAGVLLFHEATTPWLGLGVALTIAGLLYMSRKDRVVAS